MAGTNPGIENLISWWKLNETSGVRIDTHGDNDLNDVATVTSNPGKQGNAGQFTKANVEYLDIADNASLSTGDIDFTFGCWVYLDTKAADMRIAGKSDNVGQREWAINYKATADRFVFAVSNDGTATKVRRANNFGAVSTATWYFIVVWHDSVNNIIGISVNGTEDTEAHTTGVFDGTDDFAIGADGSGGTPFDGRVDEPFFYKKMLSSDDRAFIYNSGSGITYENLIGFGSSGVTSKASLGGTLAHELFTTQIPNQQFVVPTPGIAEYKVRVLNHSGELVAEFSSDAWLSLNFNHNESDTSFCRFEILASDDRASLFAPENVDYLFQIWRRNKILDIDWYVEWEGFFRTSNDVLYVNNLQTVVVYSVGYMNLITRAYVMYNSGTAFASKSGVGETVMKEYVSENMGSIATTANGRIADNVVPNFQIEADLGRGDTYSGSRALRGVFESCVAASLVSGLAFDVVKIPDELLFEFRVYENQRGLDRTIDNLINDVQIFSVDMGNMSLVTLSQNRSNEKTVIYALGPGREDAREIVIDESDAQNDSPWNRIERTFNASSQAVSELSSFAAEKLKENEKITSISFTALQQVNSYYRKHYWWGDKVSVLFNGLEFALRIIEVSISVSHRNKTGEQISFTFWDDKR